MSTGSLVAFVRDSNRIEGIHRDPTPQEIEAHTEFLALESVCVEDLEVFVSCVQPGARLRNEKRLNVRVGPHVPPPGGPAITRQLVWLLMRILSSVDGHVFVPAWQAHVEYESLHPFTDGNGRSGRALWAWQMQAEGRDPFLLPVLQRLYYDALDWGRGRL